MREKYKKIYDNTLCGHSFMLKDIGASELEFKFEKSNHYEDCSISFITLEGELKYNNDYTYKESFEFIKSGTWFISSKRHLMIERKI